MHLYHYSVPVYLGLIFWITPFLQYLLRLLVTMPSLMITSLETHPPPHLWNTSTTVSMSTTREWPTPHRSLMSPRESVVQSVCLQTPSMNVCHSQNSNVLSDFFHNFGSFYCQAARFLHLLHQALPSHQLRLHLVFRGVHLFQRPIMEFCMLALATHSHRSLRRGLAWPLRPQGLLLHLSLLQLYLYTCRYTPKAGGQKLNLWEMLEVTCCLPFAWVSWAFCLQSLVCSLKYIVYKY